MFKLFSGNILVGSKQSYAAIINHAIKLYHHGYRNLVILDVKRQLELKLLYA